MRLSSRPCSPSSNFYIMLSSVAVNSLGEMVSPCLTPPLNLIVSLSLCRCTVTELSGRAYTSHAIIVGTSSGYVCYSLHR